MCGGKEEQWLTASFSPQVVKNSRIPQGFFFFCMPSRFILSAGAESLCTATATASVFAELEQLEDLELESKSVYLCSQDENATIHFL